VCALRAGIGYGDNIAPKLILQIEVKLLDGRLSKIRIGDGGSSEKSVPSERRTGERVGYEIRE
jgi:hypothetical protein